VEQKEGPHLMKTSFAPVDWDLYLRKGGMRKEAKDQSFALSYNAKDLRPKRKKKTKTISTVGKMPG